MCGQHGNGSPGYKIRQRSGHPEMLEALCLQQLVHEKLVPLHAGVLPLMFFFCAYAM